MFNARCVFESGGNELPIREVRSQNSGNLFLSAQVDTGCIGSILRTPTCEAWCFIIISIQWHSCQRVKILAIDHSGFDDIVTEPDHSATTDSRKRGVTKMLNLKHDANIGWEVKAFTIRQCEQLVVIKHTVGCGVRRVKALNEPRT